MGAAVAEAEHASPGAPSSSARTSRLPGVAAEEVVHERVAVVGDGPVVEELLGVAAERRRPARRGWSTGRARSPAPGADGNTASRLREHQVAEPRDTPGAGRSARIAAFTSGSAMRGGALGHGQVREASYVGRPRNACDVRSPQNRPCPCELTCGTMRAPCGVLPLDAVELVAPRAAASAAERERDHEAGLA